MKITCDVPSCLDARDKRGQANGRWLMSVEFNDGTVTLTTNCKECGGVHSVTLEIPKALAQAPLSFERTPARSPTRAGRGQT